MNSGEVNKKQAHRLLSADLSKQDLVVLVVFITLLGTLIRGYLVLRADFPLNDGGMFYTMIQDLQAVHYKLPLFTSYNSASIPFAYPPFPFYLTGVLNSWFHIPLLQLLRFLPLIFSILTIPAFYRLACQLLRTDRQRLLATLIFALLPQVYIQQIMGGGLTRSPALFFAILAMSSYLRWAKLHRIPDFGKTVLFTALTALCHLEMLWMLALSLLLFFLFLQRSWKGFVRLTLIGVGTALVTAFWWGSVMIHFGPTLFMNVWQSSGNANFWAILATFLFQNPRQDLLQIIFSLFAIAGIFHESRENNWLLAIWWLVFILFDARTNQRSSALPISLLAGITLDIGLQWISVNWLSKKIQQNVFPVSVTNIWPGIILAGLVLFVVINNLFVTLAEGTSLVPLNQENRVAMQWARLHTAKESRFLIIDFPSSWSTDLVSEWFPTLASRQSVMTAQGEEWLPGKAQTKTITALTSLDVCKMLGLNCFQKWQQEHSISFDYLYFTGNMVTNEIAGQFTSPLEAQIFSSKEYTLVYSNSDVRIFRKKNQ